MGPMFPESVARVLPEFGERFGRMTAREVRVLEVRVLDVLSTSPGLTRAELAERLGVEPPHVHRPVTNLLHAGRVHRTGHKEASRYWVAEATTVAV